MTANSLPPGRRLLFGVLTVLITVVIGAAVLELAVRLLFPRTDFLWQGDPQLGMKLIPRKQGRSVVPGAFDVPVQVNSAGFRDREHAVEKKPGVRRVVLLGDSFIEALQVPFERSITALLEQRLQRTVAGVETLNFGVSGTGTARQYLALREYGLQYEPDLVLVFFFGNDVSDNSRRLQGRTYVPYPHVTADGGLARDAAGRPLFTRFAELESGSSPLTKTIKEHWKTYRFLRELVDTNPALGKLAYRLNLVSEPPQVSHATGSENFGFFEIYRTQPKAVWAEAWRVTEELMLATRDLASANGARLAVVLIPAAWEVYPHKWEQALKQVPAMRSASMDLDLPARRLTTFLEGHGVLVIPLLPAFRKHAAGSQSLYFDNDGHWTAAGHELAAEILAQRLPQLMDTSGSGRPGSVNHRSAVNGHLKQ